MSQNDNSQDISNEKSDSDEELVAEEYVAPRGSARFVYAAPRGDGIKTLSTGEVDRTDVSVSNPFVTQKLHDNVKTGVTNQKINDSVINVESPKSPKEGRYSSAFLIVIKYSGVEAKRFMGNILRQNDYFVDETEGALCVAFSDKFESCKTKIQFTFLSSESARIEYHNLEGSKALNLQLVYYCNEIANKRVQSFPNLIIENAEWNEITNNRGRLDFPELTPAEFEKESSALLKFLETNPKEHSGTIIMIALQQRVLDSKYGMIDRIVDLFIQYNMYNQICMVGDYFMGEYRSNSSQMRDDENAHIRKLLSKLQRYVNELVVERKQFDEVKSLSKEDRRLDIFTSLWEESEQLHIRYLKWKTDKLYNALNQLLVH